MTTDFSKVPGVFVGQAREQAIKGHTQYKLFSSGRGPFSAYDSTDEQILEKVRTRSSIEAEFFEYTMRLRKYLEEIVPDKDIEIGPLIIKIIDK